MKKYLCYDSNIGIVFYLSDSKEACEDECVNMLDVIEDYDVADLNDRFAIYERVQTFGVSWNDEDVE